MWVKLKLSTFFKMANGHTSKQVLETDVLASSVTGVTDVSKCDVGYLTMLRMADGGFSECHEPHAVVLDKLKKAGPN